MDDELLLPELATALRTTRRAMAVWSKHFAAHCPRNRSLSAWQKFMREFCLGPYGASATVATLEPAAIESA